MVNIDEMEWNERAHGERFAMQHKRIGSQARHGLDLCAAYAAGDFQEEQDRGLLRGSVTARTHLPHR
jgi:hypothetical protein